MQHRVLQGDSIDSIADQYGYFAETIWNAGENFELKSRRKDRNTLQPGDLVVVPPPREKMVSRPTDAVHTFKRKGVPAKYRLQVLREGKPLADAAFKLAVDGKPHASGVTDGNGFLEEFVPPGARFGELEVTFPPPEKPLRLVVRFGHLDPITSVSGVAKRLANLRFIRYIPSHSPMRMIWHGVRRLQQACGLPATGVLDAKTLAELERLHDTPATTPDQRGDSSHGFS
jgi:hypothetical protein